MKKLLIASLITLSIFNLVGCDVVENYLLREYRSEEQIEAEKELFKEYRRDAKKYLADGDYRNAAECIRRACKYDDNNKEMNNLNKQLDLVTSFENLLNADLLNLDQHNLDVIDAKFKEMKELMDDGTFTEETIRQEVIRVGTSNYNKVIEALDEKAKRAENENTFNRLNTLLEEFPKDLGNNNIEGAQSKFTELKTLSQQAMNKPDLLDRKIEAMDFFLKGIQFYNENKSQYTDLDNLVNATAKEKSYSLFLSPIIVPNNMSSTGQISTMYYVIFKDSNGEFVECQLDYTGSKFKEIFKTSDIMKIVEDIRDNNLLT